MQLIESNRLLSTCKRCGLKFEVNSLITYITRLATTRRFDVPAPVAWAHGELKPHMLMI